MEHLPQLVLREIKLVGEEVNWRPKPTTLLEILKMLERKRREVHSLQISKAFKMETLRKFCKEVHSNVGQSFL